MRNTFRGIEKNLDSTICTPRHSREELEQHVHRPEFRHAVYTIPSIPPLSTNLASLIYVQKRLNIEDDPYVISLYVAISQATVYP
jgi:endoribonuclease Dicer